MISQTCECQPGAGRAGRLGVGSPLGASLGLWVGLRASWRQALPCSWDGGGKAHAPSPPPSSHPSPLPSTCCRDPGHRHSQVEPRLHFLSGSARAVSAAGGVNLGPGVCEPAGPRLRPGSKCAAVTGAADLGRRAAAPGLPLLSAKSQGPAVQGGRTGPRCPALQRRRARTGRTGCTRVLRAPPSASLRPPSLALGPRRPAVPRALPSPPCQHRRPQTLPGHGPCLPWDVGLLGRWGRGPSQA